MYTYVYVKKNIYTYIYIYKTDTYCIRFRHFEPRLAWATSIFEWRNILTLVFACMFRHKPVATSRGIPHFQMPNIIHGSCIPWYPHGNPVTFLVKIRHSWWLNPYRNDGVSPMKHFWCEAVHLLRLLAYDRRWSCSSHHALLQVVM